jgi:hypothetical protein
MFLILLTMIMICSLSFEKFPIYYMKNDQLRRNNEQYMYDCLHYYVKDNLNNEKEDSILIHQIILYCFRP